MASEADAVFKEEERLLNNIWEAFSAIEKFYEDIPGKYPDFADWYSQWAKDRGFEITDISDWGSEFDGGCWEMGTTQHHEYPGYNAYDIKKEYEAYSGSKSIKSIESEYGKELQSKIDAELGNIANSSKGLINLLKSIETSQPAFYEYLIEELSFDANIDAIEELFGDAFAIGSIIEDDEIPLYLDSYWEDFIAGGGTAKSIGTVKAQVLRKVFGSIKAQEPQSLDELKANAKKLQKMIDDSTGTVDTGLKNLLKAYEFMRDNMHAFDDWMSDDDLGADEAIDYIKKGLYDPTSDKLKNWLEYNLGTRGVMTDVDNNFAGFVDDMF